MNIWDRARAGKVEPVQVIVKSFGIVEALARDGELGVSELSEKTGLTKSTTYRMVRTLVGLGYVRQNNTNDKYDLTLRLFEMGAAALERSDVLTAARDVIEGISRETREAVHVAVLDERDIVYVDTADSSHALTMSPRIGGRTDAHCTALGKVLLASMQDAEIKDLYRNVTLTRRTQHTVTDLDTLISILHTVRENGFSIDYEEYEEGLMCIATGLRDHVGTVVAAMALAAPCVRLPEKRVSEIVETMVMGAREVSRRAGAQQEAGALLSPSAPNRPPFAPARRKHRTGVRPTETQLGP